MKTCTTEFRVQGNLYTTPDVAFSLSLNTYKCELYLRACFSFDQLFRLIVLIYHVHPVAYLEEHIQYVDNSMRLLQQLPWLLSAACGIMNCVFTSQSVERPKLCRLVRV